MAPPSSYIEVIDQLSIPIKEEPGLNNKFIIL